MSSTTDTTPPSANRWEALKSSVIELTKLIAATAPPGGKLGLVLFADKAPIDK